MSGYIDHYRLQEVIGVGSFATVHRAVDDRLDASVVLKVLAENHSLNPEIRERFIAEGRSLRRVRSPHVVTVHDIGESDRQQPYLVLELAGRGTLADRVDRLRARGWRPEAADVLALARPLAAALTAVHGAELVHRDLSPGNVLLAVGVQDGPDGELVRADERVLLADLGMCKDLAYSSGLTVAGGTSGFRPPEQTGGPGVVDPRADLWALSALIGWLCEGSRLTVLLEPVLSKGLAEDPAERHRDVAAWLADIEQALAAPSRPEAAGASPTRSGALPRRWLALVVAALLVGAAAGVLGSVLLGPGDRAGEASLVIDGPVSVAPAQVATFSIDAAGMRSWVWELPDGRYVVGAQQVTLTPTSAGNAIITVRGQALDGSRLEVRHRFSVE
ncbi:MAG: serine/threonine-protein kinase [Beutenbergiaceae bacterium]